MNSRIMVEITKLPMARRTVQLFAGDSVLRGLVEAFGDGDYTKYSISINGQEATLNTTLANGDVVSCAALIKGNC